MVQSSAITMGVDINLALRFLDASKRYLGKSKIASLVSKLQRGLESLERS